MNFNRGNPGSPLPPPAPSGNSSSLPFSVILLNFKTAYSRGNPLTPSRPFG